MPGRPNIVVDNVNGAVGSPGSARRKAVLKPLGSNKALRALLVGRHGQPWARIKKVLLATNDMDAVLRELLWVDEMSRAAATHTANESAEVDRRMRLAIRMPEFWPAKRARL